MWEMIIAICAAVAGAATGAVADLYKANSQKSSLKQQAENEKYQAMLSERQAGDVQERGEVEAERRSRQIRRDISAARANYAGNGLLVDSGTAGDVEGDIDAEGRQDIDIINLNTQRAAWGYEAQAAQHSYAAKAYKTAAKQAAQTGWINVGSDLLTAGGQANKAGMSISSYYSNRGSSGSTAVQSASANGVDWSYDDSQSKFIA